MFQALGNFVNRYWAAILVGWVVLAIGLKFVAPTWDQVALDGDFDYLPSSSTSRRGLDLLHKAFPDEKAKSQIVLVFAREDAPLTKVDRQFAITVANRLAELKPDAPANLLRVAEAAAPSLEVKPSHIVNEMRLMDEVVDEETEPAADEEGPPIPSLHLSESARRKLLRELSEKFEVTFADSSDEPIETFGQIAAQLSDDLPWADDENRVWTELTPVVGQMLMNNGRTSEGQKHLDGHAVMVVGRLTTDMMATENVQILKAVTRLVDEARIDIERPPGLKIGLSGSAMIGGDMQASVKESLKSTEITTVVLVLVCLLVIYRSPLLVVIPMATIGVSLSVATDVVALLALHFGPDAHAWSDFKIFTTTKIFVIVILFGAGTDFCLFLISRFKEELGLGTPLEKASGTALTNVGDALAASAFTTILGLATMAFAEYGKFSYAGPVVAICLFVAVLACISFAPALLRAFGKFVFWPFGVNSEQKPVDPDGDFDAQMKQLSPVWDWVARGVLRRPGLILWLALGGAAWFMIEGMSVEVTHDFMNELSADRASKQGTQLVREYFAPGEAAPMSVVATLPDGKLDESDGFYTIAYLHGLLQEIDGVADVRSLYRPAGGTDEALNLAELTILGSPLAVSTFVSEAGEYRGEVTQFHLVLDKDPFAREARTIVDDIEQVLATVTSGEAAKEQPPRGLTKKQLDHWTDIREGLPKWEGATFEYIGTTPGMRDLEHVTNRDDTTIKICVVIAVFLVIWLILKRPVVCLYLIATVLLSYFATIGATEMFFRWYYGDSFDGLDWKAPIFLFVILIAVGQDYNIYLTTRVFEEQKKYGPHRGLRKAMVQTGGIITSCGIIMAGTFISMASGSLRGMIELGAALSFGVLLDTFFVRTVVVPCFFALMAGKEPEASEPPSDEPDGEANRNGQSTSGKPHLPHSAVKETAS